MRLPFASWAARTTQPANFDSLRVKCQSKLGQTCGSERPAACSVWQRPLEPVLFERIWFKIRCMLCTDHLTSTSSRGLPSRNTVTARPPCSPQNEKLLAVNHLRRDCTLTEKQLQRLTRLHSGPRIQYTRSQYNYLHNRLQLFLSLLSDMLSPGYCSLDGLVHQSVTGDARDSRGCPRVPKDSSSLPAPIEDDPSSPSFLLQIWFPSGSCHGFAMKP